MTSNPYMNSLLAARAADEGEKTGPQPVAWRWKHQRDERWTYGQQPKHRVPPRGKELIGYYIVEPLFAEPPTPEWTLREQLGRVCEERDALRALLAEARQEMFDPRGNECRICHQYEAHAVGCLVVRIYDALRSER